MLCIVMYGILGLQAIVDLTSIDELHVPFVRSNDTSPSLIDNFKEFIRDVKKVHDPALARPADERWPDVFGIYCDRLHALQPSEQH